MARQYLNMASSTGLATAVALLTIAAIPPEFYELPPIIKVPYGAYSEQNATVASSTAMLSEIEKAEILTSFAKSLAENSRSLDPRVSQIISDDFWDMYEGL